MLVKIISIMLEKTYSTDDLVERLALMRAYYGKRLFAGGEHETVRSVLTGQCDAHTLRVLEGWDHAFNEQGISPLVVYEALDAIGEDMAGVPAVTLYVPIKFSPEHIERFGKWFRANIQPNILLSIRTDPRAAGGCGVIYKHTYHDLSLRYFIHEHRGDIVSMFDRYTHAEHSA